MAVKPLPTQARLRELLRYDPATGIFTWLERRAPAAPAGSVAGTRAGRYLVIYVDGIAYLAHRLAWMYMTGSAPVDAVDHRDLNKLNNVWANLREATRQQNSHNIGLRKDNTSGCRGVSWHKRERKWTAYISDPSTKRRRDLGFYKDREAAIAARRLAEEEVFGEYRYQGGS